MGAPAVGNKGVMTQQYRPVQSKMKIQAGEATVVADTTSPLTEQHPPPPNSHAGMQPNLQRIFCHRCKGYGHLARDCNVAVFLYKLC